MLPLNPQENRFAAVMRRDPKHAEELDNKLQENVVQKNHLLQVLNKEDLEGPIQQTGGRPFRCQELWRFHHCAVRQ